MNIDSLLKHIHPLIKKAIADLAKEATVVFSEKAKEAEDAAERTKIEECFNSFKRQAMQMDKAIMAKLQEQFTELSGETLDQVAKEYKVQMTADDLRLVEEADLEQQVSLETMAAKVLNSVMGELNLFTQRLNAAYKRKDIDDKTNPLGPALFVANFGEACSKINANIDQKLLINKVFERTALPALKNILANANANLKSQGILPNAEVIHKSSRSAVGGGGGGGAGSGGNNAGGNNAGAGGNGSGAMAAGGNSGALNIPMTSPNGSADAGGMNIPMATNMHTPSGMFNIADPIVKQIYEMVARDGYGVLQKLLSESSGGVETRISSAGVGDQHFSQKKEVEDTELLDILNTLQHQARENTNAAPVLEGEYQRASVAKNIGSVLQAKSQKEGAETALSKSGNDVVNLVDMLFDFILSDDYLSDSVKAIISELQVPLTKVALLDKTFFSDNQHPARLLLNELSRSGMSVSKEANALEDKTYQSISKTVNEVKEFFQSETTIFKSALDDFSSDINKQSKRTNVLEQRLMDVEKGRAKSEHANEMVQDLYAKMRANVPVSKEVNEFLNTAWRDVLLMTCLKFGSHSKQWKDDAEITKKLMKSLLMAKKARLDQKRMKIPMDLLKLLKKAMDRIAYDALETKRLLSNLAKNYQVIAAASAESVRDELIEFGGSTAAAVRVVAKKKPETIDAEFVSKLIVVDSEPEPIPSSETASSVSDALEQNAFKAAPKPKKELSEEQKKKKEQKEQALAEEIAKEKEKIANSPLAAIEETIKNIDQDIFKAVPELVADEEEINEFVPGNSWFDMASGLAVGTWVELVQASTKSHLRCKLVANIRTLEKLIFVNKAGAKVAERKVVELARELKDKEAKVVNDNTIFDQALENVIVNLRAK